jgi:quercetin dioxygenase-like cupin family protein
MQIIELLKAATIDVPFEARKLVTLPGLELVHMVLEPGQSVPAHALPITVLFYVLSGTGTLAVDGRAEALGPDTLALVPAHSQRGWTNHGSESLRLLVVKQMAS